MATPEDLPTVGQWQYFRGDFLIYAFAKLLFGLSSFAVLRLFTEAMNPTSYGSYALLFGVVMISSTVPTAFLTSAIVRFLPEALAHGRVAGLEAIVYHLAFPAIFAAMITTALLLAGCATWDVITLSPERVAAVLLSTCFASWYQLRSVHAYAMRRRRLYAKLMIAQLSVFLLGAALLPTLPIEPVAGGLLCLAASYGLSLALFRLPTPPTRLRLMHRASDLAWSLVRYGTPVVGVNLALQLNTYLGQFMLTAMTSQHDVGLYASNYVVADKIVYALASVIALTIEPLLYREWGRASANGSYQMVWKCAFLFIGLAVPGMIIFLAFLNPIMSLLTDSSFEAGRVILPLVLPAALMSGLASVFSNILTLHKRTGDIAVIYLSAVLINLLFNLILIPKFGIVGAAYSTLLSFTILFGAIFIRAQMLANLTAEFVPALTSMLKGLKVVR